jgi:hypothetical protein
MTLICGNIWPKVVIICDICGKKNVFLIFTVSVKTLFKIFFAVSVQTHDKPKYKELLKI